MVTKHISVTELKDKYFRLLQIIPLVLCLSLLLCSVPVDTYAQRAKGESDTGGRKTTKAPAMSESVYKKLTAAQELIEAGDHTGGLEKLRDLEQSKRLSNYERAQIYNYFAYTYFSLENYPEAIRAYRNVLATPELPEALELNSVYTLSQLYFIQEDYRKAIELLNRWFELTELPTENAYMVLGQAYYQLEEYKEAITPLMAAYNLVKERGKPPKENLLLLLQACHLNLGDYKSVLTVSRELVVRYPKRTYWITMSGAYAELKQYDKQMAIFEMLFERGDLPRGNQQLNLANLYLMHDVPYKAAKVIDQGMKKELIKEEVRSLRLLSQAWTLSREDKKSIPPLKMAANLTEKDGQLDLRLAHAYMNTDRYKEAISSLRTALKKGGLRRPDQANEMLGLALFETKNYNSAINAFQAASKDKRSRTSANRWIAHVKNERARDEQIKEALQKRRR